MQNADLAGQRVCVVGLGYVGLTLATALADVGFEVHGVERLPDVIEQLKRGVPHFHEPGLDESLRRVIRLNRLCISRQISAECPATIFIITVGTPLGPNGKARLDMLEQVSRDIAAVLKPGDLVIARSTVVLGTTRKIIKPILDSAGVDYSLAFCPERTVEGSALRELRWLPQVVGAETLEARMRASSLFNALTPTIIRLGSLEAAEMIKLIDNTYRDVTFAFANEVARLCDAAGVDVVDVITAGKFGYPRTSVPMPGPVGGPCLEKDPYILAESLRGFGVEPTIALAARSLNETQPADVIHRLRLRTDGDANWPRRPIITLMGLAFKGRPVNDDLRGTMARPLLAAIRNEYPTAILRGFDALVKPDVIADQFGIEPLPNIDAAISGANIVVIANNHPCFENLGWEDRSRMLSRPAVIYDLWNQARAAELQLPDGVSYIGLGDGRLGVH
jgi:nucleotide sugar dehydrogenase